jgi:hypothetical protein
MYELKPTTYAPQRMGEKSARNYQHIKESVKVPYSLLFALGSASRRKNAKTIAKRFTSINE